MVLNSILEAIGNTPMVRLSPEGDGPTVLGKVEYLNPGGSGKDRMALRMIEVAEQSGELTEDSTIIEGTSGNTGAGLCMVAASRGYRTIVVLSDKVSPEKISLLRAYGAQIVLTSAGYPSSHPLSVRSTVRRLVHETPHAWTPDQYHNPHNVRAHYEGTGPEIWRDTGGAVTHLVTTVGTGGVVSGVGTYLKDVSDNRVQVIAADPFGSAYSGDITPYLVEGAGRADPEDDWPSNFRSDVVDRFVPVTDAVSFAATRKLATHHGILAGLSSGTVFAAATDIAAELPSSAVIVCVLLDSGRGYLGKLMDTKWLTEHGLPQPDNRHHPPVCDIR